MLDPAVFVDELAHAAQLPETAYRIFKRQARVAVKGMTLLKRGEHVAEHAHVLLCDVGVGLAAEPVRHNLFESRSDRESLARRGSVTMVHGIGRALEMLFQP